MATSIKYILPFPTACPQYQADMTIQIREASTAIDQLCITFGIGVACAFFVDVRWAPITMPQAPRPFASAALWCLEASTVAPVGQLRIF